MASVTPFEGHVIAITGAASGIGLATAHYLAVRGATLSLADLQSEPLESAARDIRAITSSARILTTVLDVRDEGQVEAWVARTVKEFGKLSGAANIAGVLGKGFGITDLKDLGTAEWEFIMGVNLTGVFNCLRAELNAIEHGGSIVNAASVGGVVGLSK
jgi:NAD(P)-dependent dehydrogenase (short-subunit alcohol dehydrogenase family)